MSVTKNQLSRRQMVGGLGMSLAASVPGVAQSSMSSPAAQPLQDPTGKYPKPPFKGQSQPWPGLASKMDPNPIMERPATAGLADWPDGRRS
jgi:hypothetical protein